MTDCTDDTTPTTKTPRDATRPRFANATQPQVRALIAGQFRFADMAAAQLKLDYFRSRFTNAVQDMSVRENTDTDVEGASAARKPCAVLWIRGFALTPDEEDAGFLGNYAYITPQRLSNGQLTLACLKLEAELRNHPRRRRRRMHMPNWKHPVLRAAQAQHCYMSIEAAQAQLDRLHLEYPETTIPNITRLYVMVYERERTEGERAVRYILRIQPHPEGGFMLECTPNTFQRPQLATVQAQATQPTVTEEQPTAPGYFASVVALKRHRKTSIAQLKAQRTAQQPREDQAFVEAAS